MDKNTVKKAAVIVGAILVFIIALPFLQETPDSSVVAVTDKEAIVVLLGILGVAAFILLLVLGGGSPDSDSPESD